MTSKSSAASAGGSAGASGVDFQNLVFAWAASALLAEEPLLVQLVAGTAIQVGAQTGFPVDDAAVLTDLGNAVFFQAKVGLNLGTAENSPLAKALEHSSWTWHHCYWAAVAAPILPHHPPATMPHTRPQNLTRPTAS